MNPQSPIRDAQSAAQLPVAVDRKHLKIPNKLYGRDQDIAALLESFERISGGHGEVLLVPGDSGVGKTALVQELRGPVQNRNGFFIKGKFDQYQQNIPYFAFRQALAGLCRELQSADAHQRSRFKTEILQAVGNLGQVLVDLVPEFGAFLGAQPPLEDISPQEARHRFADVCRNFLKVICWPEHPLVLFIDDWQWADAASCELLKQMQVGTTLRYLLVIASYRDNEVDSGHPLMSAVDDLRRQAVPVAELHVKNITAKDVREFVADTLKSAAEDVAGLAAIIHAKTLGNPFFARSFLDFLHEVQLIGFDPARNCWQWSMDKIGGADLPDDAVGLFVLKLRRLDHDSRNLFSLAACLGNRFDLETLGMISGRSSGECLALLCSDQTRDMLRPLDGDGGNAATENPCAPQTCVFVHDRIQQAAYSLIEPAELPKLRLKIGRLLLASLPPEKLAEQLFEVVGGLNAGFHLMEDAAEREKVLELNLTAARNAYAATAYRSALQFYRAANRFLETPGFAGHLWRDRHELTLQLFKERAGCEFLEGNLIEAEQCVQQAVAHAGTAIEKADALSILIVQYTLLARYPEAIAAGRQALAALGISLPEADYEKARKEEIAQARRELGGRPVSSLIELPVMSDPAMLMASKILITLGPPCYRSHQRLWSVIVPRVVNLTLRYGNIPQIGYSHTAFGGLLGWVDDDYATAREFGELATRLMTGTFRSPSDQSVFYLMIGSSIRHWFQHLRHGTQDYKDAYEIGLRSGNLQYAAYAFGHDMYCRFYQGAPLAGLIQETQRSLAFSRTRRNQWAIDLLEGGLNIFGALSGATPAANGNDAWSETDFLRRLADHQNIQVTCIYKVLQTFSLLLAGHHEDALALSDETEPLIYTVGTQGLLPWPEHVFARLLILTALYSNADEKRRAKWRTELDAMLRRLRTWADNGPDNFEHKYLLAAAELARIDGRPGEAIPLYDQAVAAARTGNFLQWEGLANERAHDFWLERGNERLAHVYWQQAYVCFSRWGAAAKVGSMETDCRALLVKNLPGGAGSGKLEPEIETALVERQINQLRDQASQAQHARLHGETEAQTEELAHAMERVRVEIAERKRTEAALRESEERFKSLFIEAPLGIALIDSLTGHIYELNPMFAKIAGRTMEEMASIDWMSITHPDDVQEDVDNMALLNAGKIPGFQMEKRYLHHDGTPVWISMTIAPVHVDDKAHPRHLCMIKDITERKTLEASLAEALLQANDANNAKSEFLGIMTHELRNPLSSVLGSAELLSDTALDDEQKGYVRTISSSGEHLLAVVNDTLDFASIEAGTLAIHAAPFDLAHLVKLSSDIVRKSFTDKGLAFHCDVAADVPAQITGDERRIRQILINLLANAVKFTSDGSVSFRVTRSGEFLDFSVEDTGLGISSEALARLFQLFTQADSTIHQKYGGTGLGLAVSQRLAEAMGGTITVASTPGKGSTFTFHFPLEVPAGGMASVPSHLFTGADGTSPSSPSAETPVRPDGLPVLVVDDDADSRTLAGKMLQSLGYRAEFAADGAEAVQAFMPGKYLTILMDMAMPVMDGLDATKKIREIEAATEFHVPIIAFTANVMPGGCEQSLAAGLDDFLSKPFKRIELAAKLDNVSKRS